MIKKMLGVFTSVVAALAVVGVAWAGTDDATSTSVTTAGETSTSVSVDDSSSSTDATFTSSTDSTDATVGSSTDATVASSTGATVDSSTSTSLDDSSSSTSTSIAASTSTSADSNSTTSTTVGSSTSTSVDDNDRNVVPDGVTVHTIPGVGSVTIEAALGQLILVDVSAPGWNVEFDKVESDRIELEFTSAADAEAEFEARIDDGRVEVRIELD